MLLKVMLLGKPQPFLKNLEVNILKFTVSMYLSRETNTSKAVSTYLNEVQHFS